MLCDEQVLNIEGELVKAFAANERSYLSYVEISGMCWGLGIVLYHQEGIRSLVALSMILSSISVLFALIAKKYRLTEANKPLYSLEHRYGLIIMDFMLKYCVYGLGACALNLLIHPESMAMQLNFTNGLLILHAIFVLIIRFFYSIFAEKERVESENATNGGVNNG